MTDDELVRRFEGDRLESFRHADHVRLAWAYLEREGFDGALARLLDGLARFAAAKGHPGKFHHTLTRAWLELIVVARREHPAAGNAADLLVACPALADPATVRRFYSEAWLQSDPARTGWLPPDLRPFEGAGGTRGWHRCEPDVQAATI